MYRILLRFVTIVSILHISNATPLDDYVNKPDPVFAWKLIKTHYELTHTVYILNMTSQQWFDGTIIETRKIFFIKMTLFLASFSSRSIWWHYMVITVPRIHSRPKIGYMLIGGETNLDP